MKYNSTHWGYVPNQDESTDPKKTDTKEAFYFHYNINNTHINTNNTNGINGIEASLLKENQYLKNEYFKQLIIDYMSVIQMFYA